MILLFQTYDTGTRYGPDVNDRFNYGTIYAGQLYHFDEATRTVRHTQEDVDDYQDHSPPAEFSFPGEVFTRCAGTTFESYVHDGAGGFAVVPTADSLSCGFVPATPPSCDLALTFVLTPTESGAHLLATSADAHGAVQYRLDGGRAQSSPTFYNVPPGRHVLTATDTGVASCVRSVAVEVATPAPPPAPAGPVAGVDFVEQPLWYRLAAAGSAEVLLELYAESAHGAEDFALVFRCQKRADASGRLHFRLDTLLSPLLRPLVPPASQLATVRARTPLLNYFVRTATVPAPGTPAAYVTSPLRTALRGSLPAEHRDVDYFAYRLEAYGQPPFLSWQPAGKRITAEQPEWLFWLCPSTEPTAMIVRRTYAYPGLPSLVEDEALDLSAGRGPMGQLLAIPVRPRAGTASVSVALYDADDIAWSPLVSFTMAPATDKSRYLLFSNSLGGFDVLHTTGRLEALLDGAADRAELPALPQSSGVAADVLTYAVRATRQLRLATGWLTAAQLRWLQELVFARELWEWKRGRLLPLDVAKRKLTYESDDAPLRGLLLEFDYAFTPSAYADLP